MLRFHYRINNEREKYRRPETNDTCANHLSVTPLEKRASNETDARAQGLKQSSAWPSCSVDGACSSCRNDSYRLMSGSPSFL
jgi:hypothetical protein